MHKMKRSILLGLMLVAMFLMAACQSSAPKTETPAAETVAQTVAFPLTLTDASGKEVTFDKAAESVVSLSPSTTEMVFALGKGALLKGRTDYCDYPNEALSVPSMGSIMEPNLEAIVAAKPDVVFISGMFSDEVKTKMEGLGLKVFDISSHDSFDGVYTALDHAGQILSAKEASDKLVADMKATVADVQEKVKGAEAKSAYYVVGYGESGDYTAGKGTFIDQMITMAGGVNAAGDVEGWSYSLEKLIEKNPDYLICRNNGDDKKGISAANGYKDLTAVKEGRLIEIDSDLLDIQGPRSAEGVLMLAKILHPELFK